VNFGSGFEHQYGGGNDTINGDDGKDVQDGREGDDKLMGQEAEDYMSGKNGNDHLSGGPGFDVLGGGPGPDLLVGGGGRNDISAQDGIAGNNIVDCSLGSDVCYIDRDTAPDPDVTDHYTGCEGVTFRDVP
jgi:Ca2+-binding RTX toxin-like protein